MGAVVVAVALVVDAGVGGGGGCAGMEGFGCPAATHWFQLRPPMLKG